MRRLNILVAVLGILLAALPAGAQNFPTKPIRLVVPYPPGGTTDLVGRLYATKLRDMLGQPVVVENRSGANGNIAAHLVARAPADGTTLLLHSSAFVINPLLYKTPGYQPLTQFTPIGLVFDTKLIIVAHPSLGVRSLRALVAAAREKPGEITCASPGGVGDPTYLAVEMFRQIAGIDLLHVPYQGDAAAVNDLRGGHVMMMFGNPAQTLPHVKAGRLIALAVTGLQRMRQAPDLPTVAELGYPGFDVGTWYGIWGPAGMAPGVVETLSAALAKIGAMPDVQKNLAAQGLNVTSSTPAELSSFQRSEQERWGRVIRAANLAAE